MGAWHFVIFKTDDVKYTDCTHPYSQCNTPVYLISLIVMCLAPNVDTGDPHCQIKFATQKQTFYLLLASAFIPPPSPYDRQTAPRHSCDQSIGNQFHLPDSPLTFLAICPTVPLQIPRSVEKGFDDITDYYH